MTNYKIGQAAKITGLPAKTIRFYEEEGVIASVARADNGYRSYSPSTIEELKLLKYARDLGLPLTEIKKLMKGCEDGDCVHSDIYINSVIDNYLNLLDEKIRRMKTLKTKLGNLKIMLKNNKTGRYDNVYCCDILHQLIEFSKKGGEDNNGRMLR